MAWTKLKITVGAVVGVLLAAGTTTVIVKAIRTENPISDWAAGKAVPGATALSNLYSQATAHGGPVSDSSGQNDLPPPCVRAADCSIPALPADGRAVQHFDGAP